MNTSAALRHSMIKKGKEKRMRKAEASGEEGKALRTIAPAYAGKGGVLTAALQYVYQTVRLGAGEDAEKGREIEALAGEKLRDFEELGACIRRLGADPVFTACPPYPVSYHSCAGVDYAKTFPAMLAADIHLERGLITMFDAMLAEVEQADAVATLTRLRAHAVRNLGLLAAMLERA